MAPVPDFSEFSHTLWAYSPFPLQLARLDCPAVLVAANIRPYMRAVSGPKGNAPQVAAVHCSRHPIAGHDDGLSRLHFAEHRCGLVAMLPLGNGSIHRAKCSMCSAL